VAPVAAVAAASPEAAFEGGPPGEWPPGFAASQEDRDAILVLSHLESLTPRDLRRVAREEGTAVRCLAAIRSGAVGTEGDRDTVRRVDLSSVRAALGSARARVAYPGDPEYMPAVLDLVDPPACLFLRGRPLPVGPAIAVVGARLCSPYGLEMTSGIASGVAAAGVAVISGAALGIDAAAHRGALQVDGHTVAVLGSGVDVPHPRSNRRLIEDIARVGTVVSEYPPGTPPAPRRFPARNRIIAALSRAVVVVEGAAGSGSLLTADFAVDLHRDVMAVPGPVTSPLSEAPHALIRDGAALVRSPEDVLAPLGLEAGAGNRATIPGLTEDQRAVLGALAGTGLTLEAVASRAGLPPGVAVAALVELELRGLARAAGGRYERTGKEIAGRPTKSSGGARSGGARAEAGMPHADP
jgi:DNA processing protein